MSGPVTIHIGGQTRELELTGEGALQFKDWMPGKIGIREALAFHRDPPVLALALAACLLSKDKKITPRRALKWIDAEKKRFVEIEAAITLEVKRYYADSGLIEDDDEPSSSKEKKPGEASAPAPGASASSPSGTTPTGSPVGTDSPPISSSP